MVLHLRNPSSPVATPGVSMSCPSPSPSFPNASTTSKVSSKFSFDLFFFSAKKREQKKEHDVTNRNSNNPAKEKTRYHSFRKAYTHTMDGSPPKLACTNPTTSHYGSASTFRPPPILTNDLNKQQYRSSHNCKSPAATTTLRLCQSPGGRANVQLAIPITPPSTKAKGLKATRDRRLSRRSSSAGSNCCRSSSALTLVRGAFSPSRSPSPRSSFFFLHCNDDNIDCDALVAAPGSPSTPVLGDIWRESTVDDFFSSFPQDLTCDVLRTCMPSSTSIARRETNRLIRQLVFEIRSTKWAAYFLQIVQMARNRRQLSATDAVSLRWVICAYVQHEVQTRNKQKSLQEQQLQKKMTDYRVAIQCICGASVIKYGRKGKPHQTQLMIENGETLRWTSKLLSQASKKNNSIPLASIIKIQAGPTTDVLARALQKGALALQEAKCTLSVITQTRTLDIKAKSAAEREWLHRSLSFLVDLAHDHEKRIAQQVELSIMKRMETMGVWKHGRKGRPHKTRIFINRFGEISWQGRSNNSIQLDEILHVYVGHQTSVFARSIQSGFASGSTSNCCFSLVTYNRTLDIETPTEQVRDWFVVAFRYLMDKVHEKTAALKREKAEKQLKLLNELCNGTVEVPSVAGPIAPHA